MRKHNKMVRKANRSYVKTLGERLTAMLELASPRCDIKYDNAFNIGAPGTDTTEVATGTPIRTSIETTEILLVKTVVQGRVIVEEKEAATSSASNWDTKDSLAIWTDGSRLEGKWVGYAAVYQEEDGRWKGRGVHLWRNKEVYDAEIYALAEGLDIALSLWKGGTLGSRAINQIAFFTNAQAALDRIQIDAPGEGQYLAQRIAMRERALLALGIAIEYHWVPGHKDVIDNEAADRVAKAAARNDNPTPSDFNDIAGVVGEEVTTVLLRLWADWYTSLSYLRRQATELRCTENLRWVKARQGNRSYRLTEKQKPDPTVFAARKTTVSRFFQLKTSHAHIATYQHRIKQRANALCWWCKSGATQTREHLFKRCSRWKPQQKKLWETLEKTATNTSIVTLFADEKRTVTGDTRGNGYNNTRDFRPSAVR